MCYLSYVLGFNLLILSSQTPSLLAAPQLVLSAAAPDYLIPQNHNDEDSYLGGNSSPPKGSDRRDS